MFSLAQLVQKSISLTDILTAALPSRPSKWAILLLRFNNEQSLSASAPSLGVGAKVLARVAVSGAALLPPTLLMGGTLPAMLKHGAARFADVI